MRKWALTLTLVEMVFSVLLIHRLEVFHHFLIVGTQSYQLRMATEMPILVVKLSVVVIMVLLLQSGVAIIMFGVLGFSYRNNEVGIVSHLCYHVRLTIILGVFASLLDKAFCHVNPLSTQDNIDEFYSGIRGIFNAYRPQGDCPPNASNALIIAFHFDIRLCQISMDSNSQTVYIRFGWFNNGIVEWTVWKQWLQ